MRPVFRILPGLALLILLTLACRKSAPTPAADLSIYFTCDTHGRLVPCGCFTGQYGGLTRLQSVLEQENSPGSLRLDVGDAIGGAEDYDVIQYRYLLRAYAAMNFDALNLGQREARLTAAQLRELAVGSSVPMISANLLDKASGKSLLSPYRILQRNGWRIAVIGVVDPAGLGEGLGDGLVVEKMESALGRLLPEVRKQADAIVLLAFTDEATLAKLAAEFYELDVILGGKVSQPSQKLEQHNRSLVLYVTNESRALGILRVRIHGRSNLEGVGHEVRLLNDRIPEDPRIQQLAVAYRDEVRRTKLAIDSTDRLAENVVPGVRAAAGYAGSASCVACHPSAARSWQNSRHAHAFTSLLDQRADMDPKCISCHTVGFGRPSGYRRDLAGSRLAEVGCESCHGPGSLHVEQRRGSTPVQFKFRPLAAGDCQSCHYGEFSRPFNWDEFWPRIKHGAEPLAASLP
jgi:hypothetical protein